MRLVNRLMVVVWLCMAAQVQAGTITYNLPGLIGQFTSGEPFSLQTLIDLQTVLNTPYAPYQVHSAQLFITGQITPAVVRGDGVSRPNELFSLSGLILVSLSTNGLSYLSFSQTSLSGPFDYASPIFDGPFYDLIPLPGPDNPPWGFDPEIYLSVQTQDGWDIPWLTEPPAEPFYPPLTGLEIVTPMTLTITQAYLVVEGNIIPEPASIIAMVLSGVCVLGRHRQRA